MDLHKMCVFVSPSLEFNVVSVSGVEALVKALRSSPALQLIRLTLTVFILCKPL